MRKYMFCIVLVFFLGCRRDDVVQPEEPAVVVPEKDPDEDLIKISTFYYTKQLSLWSSDLPPDGQQDIADAGVIRSYTDRFETAEEVLEYLKGQTPLYNGRPRDRFSFIDRSGEVTAEIDQALVDRLGFSVGFYYTNPTDAQPMLYVKMLDKGSPADRAGLKRGMKITAINGRSDLRNASDKQLIAFIREALKGRRITIGIQDQQGNVSQKTIEAQRYSYDPMLGHAVFDVDGKAVGYLSFSSFVAIRNAGKYTAMYDAFEQIFADFESRNIHSLIVDLRYNGGGAVTSSEYLANKMVPSHANQKLMYNHRVNTYLESLGWKQEGRLFGPVKYKKEGRLDLSHIYFLVSNSTASASELLINVLKPYVDVQVIGTYAVDATGSEVPVTTYGKPVGFFAWPIKGNEVELYATSFQTFNAAGEGDYFDGIEAQVFVREGIIYPFGSSEERMIAAALTHVKTGAYPTNDLLRSKVLFRGNRQQNGLKNEPLLPTGHIQGMFRYDEPR